MRLTFSFLTRKRYLEDWIFHSMARNRIWSWMMHGFVCIKIMLWNPSFSFLEHWISIIVYIFNIIYVLLNFHAPGCNEMAEKLTLFKFAPGWVTSSFFGEPFDSYSIHCSFYSNKTMFIRSWNAILYYKIERIWLELFKLNNLTRIIWLEKSDFWKNTPSQIWRRFSFFLKIISFIHTLLHE